MGSVTVQYMKIAGQLMDGMCWKTDANRNSVKPCVEIGKNAFKRNILVKKLFILSSVSKPAIDLVIVITGVSLAFLLNSWNEGKKEKDERLKVMTSLQHELKDI